MSRTSVRTAVLTALLAAGCAVGPNFKQPAAPEITRYGASPLEPTANTPAVSGGDAQRFILGADISSDWWTLFHSAPLNELIEHSLTNNPDLKAAQAALLAAREGVLAQRGAYYPNVSGEFSATRQGQSRVIAPTLASNALAFNLFTPEVTVSYVPDVFGLNRRTVESAQAQAEAVRFQMIATYNTLTANVVVTAIQQGSVQQQIEATHELIDIDTHILELLRYQFATGPERGRTGASKRTARGEGEAPPPATSEASRAAARPDGDSGGRLSRPGARRDVRADEPAIATGFAGEFACRPRDAAPG